MKANRAFGRFHWPEYGMEAAGMAAIMVAVCIGVVLLEHPMSLLHRAIEDAFLRRLLMGATMGTVAVLLICSPWGQRCGAHFNPAVTITYWTLGRISGWDTVMYVAAQFVGGAAGVGVARLLVGPPLAHGAIRYVVTVPGMGGIGPALLAEAVISTLLMAVILTAANSARWHRYTPYLAGGMIATFITFEGPVSGMSMNPARSLGSAIFGGEWEVLWIYFAAPLGGMQFGARLYRRAGRVFCAKLHHENGRRCIFDCHFGELISGSRE